MRIRPKAENCANGKGFDYRRSQYRIETNEMRLTYLGSFVPLLRLAIRISLITVYSYPENGRKLLFPMHTHSKRQPVFHYSASATKFYCIKNSQLLLLEDLYKILHV